MGYKKDAAKGIGAGWLALIVIIILGGLISGGIWAFGVATSGVKGQGDAISQKNSSANWVAAQARFEDLYAGIQAKDAQIGVLHADKVARPNDLTAQQTYTGVVSACLKSVSEYNADSRKFLASDFKSADLPTEINISNSNFDCKENTK